jgi:bifunctional enzyme CysN/CysC
LYAKARRGILRNFTGIDSEYEAPESPEIHLNTVSTSPEGCIDRILQAMASSSQVKDTCVS